MPEDASTENGRLEAGFWSLLAQRHPLTWWWWWSPDAAAPANLFPEWTVPAFERETADWRRLAQDSVPIKDPEVQQWGRFARWAAARLASGSYQDGAEPLRHANMAVSIVQLLDPAEQLYPRGELLDGLSQWLSLIDGVSARSFWRRVRVAAEGSRLAVQISHFRGLGGEEPGLKEKWERAKSAIEHYSLRVTQSGAEESAPIPWTTSAHVFVETWQDFRQHVTHEKPWVIDRPVSGQSVLKPGGPNFPAVQDVVVPGLSQWWVRPADDSAILYHGDRQDPSLAIGVALALWRQQSRRSRLTWALTHAPVVEGGLLFLSSGLLDTLWPAWPPVQNHVLTHWAQRRRAMAAADAWLWLEGGSPDDVLNWLCRFFSKSEAALIIPWMKCHPGYYVMAQRVFEALETAGPSPDFQHWIFSQGPVMPDSLHRGDPTPH